MVPTPVYKYTGVSNGVGHLKRFVYLAGWHPSGRRGLTGSAPVHAVALSWVFSKVPGVGSCYGPSPPNPSEGCVISAGNRAILASRSPPVSDRAASNFGGVQTDRANLAARISAAYRFPSFTIGAVDDVTSTVVAERSRPRMSPYGHNRRSLH